MMTTVISSPRRGCRPPGLVTVAKNLLRLLVVLVVLITSAAADTPAQDGGEPTSEDTTTYIYSCDDLAMDTTLVRGSVAIMGDIICDKTKIIEVAQGYGDVLIFADTIMWTKGVIFEIPKGTRVDFGAPAFVFVSNEDNKDGIFHVDGILGFLAEDPGFEAPDDATPEDLHGMVRLAPDGTVRALGDEAMYFTDSAVFVVAEPSTDKNSNSNSNSNSEAAGGSQGHSAGLAQEQRPRELEASGMDFVTYLNSCDDLPNERNPFEGVVSVTADIVCPEPKVIEIAEGGNNVLFVAADTLYTRNVRFNVRKGETMHIRAPALNFEREQGDSVEIFNLHGELHLRGDQHRFDDLVDTRMDDPHDTIHGSPDGDIITYGGSMLRFSETSVIVDAAPTDTNTYDNTYDNNNNDNDNILEQGDSAEFFTVEPQGHLGLYADRSGPLPDDGMAEDQHSRELVKEGGALDVDGQIRHTASGMRAVLAFDVQQPEKKHTVPIRQLVEIVEQSEDQQRVSIPQLVETVEQPEEQHTVPIRQLVETVELSEDQQRVSLLQFFETVEQSENQQIVSLLQFFENGDNNPSPTPPAIRPSPTPGDEHSTAANAGTGGSSNGTPKTTGTAAATESARLTSALAVVDDGLPLYTLESCNELRFERTPIQGVSGVLLLDDDIICTEKRILDVGHDVIVVSDKPDLRLKGVHFVVNEKVSLTFMVATIVLEKIEGESGELFTVEPQGVLAMSADMGSPSPDNGTEEDVHSLVALKKGGRFELDGRASFTASTMTISMRNKSEERKKNKDKNLNESNGGTCESTVEHPPTATVDDHYAAAPGSADAGVIDVTSDGGHVHTNAISTTPGFHDDAEWDKKPRRDLGSCDELDLDRNPLHGRVFITGDIVCDVKRVIEISSEAMIYAAVDDLYMRGVQFHVQQTGGLGIMVGTMTMEALERDSAEFFTVEPQGHLGLFADSVGQLPNDSIAEDKNSRVLVKAGGALDVDGQIRYTASGMRFVHEFEDQQLEDQQRDSIPQFVETVEQPEDQQTVSIPQLFENVEHPEEEQKVPVHQLLETAEQPEEEQKVPIPQLLETVEQPEDQQRVPISQLVETVEQPEEQQTVSILQLVETVERPEEEQTVSIPQLVETFEQPEEQQTVPVSQLVETVEQPEEQQTVPVSQLLENGANNTPPVPPFLRPSLNQGDRQSTAGKTDSGGNTNASSKAKRHRLSLEGMGHLPLTAIESCERLRFDRTTVLGILTIEGDILCEDQRTIEVTDKAVIVSNRNPLHFKGVHFHVHEKATLRFAFSTMLAENLEGDSSEIFTIEPEGYVGLHPTAWVPLSENGMKKDAHSLVNVRKGGEVYFGGEVRYTASSMKVAKTPVAGEELRFPSRMTSLNGRHVMTVGSDGSLVLANIARYQGLRREVMEAFNSWSSRAPQSSVDILAGLSPDYNGEDRGLDLKAKEEAEKERSPPLRPDSPAAAQGQGDGDGGDLRGRDDESTAEAGYSCVPPTGEKQDGNINDPADRDISASSTSGGDKSSSNTGGDESSSSSREGSVNMPTAISSTPEGYWGDDVVLKVTDMGDVLVAVGDRVVVQKRNPNRKVGWVKKLGNSRPAKKVKGIFRRLGRRGKRDKNDIDNDSNTRENNARDDDNRDDNKGAVRSTLYSLHVVENGFQVRLEGVFVWGWYVK
ncbi:conserved unknown protein [Ectocarpus siliculosus]|uniref:Uncharacterized protein n=1 Tax=Ectocarpus siliculosus TaxID=2880 RepID=D8LLQ5_ECTSI|nr:conserved unknown protein [Ectocarpus siliculosus]|eukprot:CBN74686.1 conserved unknown protein [Ectocarpus siliculosus]